MSDTTPQAGDTTATAGTEVQETTQPASAEATTEATPEVTTDTDADFEKLLAKHTRAIDEIKALRSTKNELRAQIDEAKRQLTDATKYAEATKQAEARAAALEAQLRTERLSSAITRHTATKRIADAELVGRLIDGDKVAWDEAGQPTNLVELIDDVLTKHPVLAGGAPVPTGAVTAPTRSTEPSSLEDLAGLRGPVLLDAINRMTKRPRAA